MATIPAKTRDINRPSDEVVALAGQLYIALIQTTGTTRTAQYNSSEALRMAKIFFATANEPELD